MMVTKEQVLDLLRQQGDEGTAQQAQSQLPDQIDTDRDSGLLSKLGINLSDLAGGGSGLDDLGNLGGGLGNLR